MSDPTNNALLARIKELEEALKEAINFIDDCVDPWHVTDKDAKMEEFKKALNK